MVLLLKDFLLNPKINRGNKGFPVIDFLYIFFIEFAIIVFAVVLVELLDINFFNKFFRDREEIYNQFLLFTVFAVIVAPVWEEYQHRYFLDYRIKSLFLSAILLLLYFFLNYDGLNPLQNAIHFLAFLFITTMLLLKKILDLVHVRCLIWGSVLFFGLFHLSNYDQELYAGNYLIIPLLVMPQLIGGFFLAFIRTQYRFVHCILYHGFFNLIISLAGYVGYHFFP